jgi:hypothetical protein
VVVTAVVQSTAIAILDGSRRQGRERGGGARRSTTSLRARRRSASTMAATQRQRATHGVSDGVSGFEGG